MTASNDAGDRFAGTFLILAPIVLFVAFLVIALGTPADADDFTQITDPQWIWWTFFAAVGGSTLAIALALLTRRTHRGDAASVLGHVALATIPLWLFIFISAGYAAGAMATEGTTVFTTGDSLVLAVDIIEALNNGMFAASGAILGLVALLIGVAIVRGGTQFGRGLGLAGVAVGAVGFGLNFWLVIAKIGSDELFALGPMATLVVAIWGAFAGISLLRNSRGSRAS